MVSRHYSAAIGSYMIWGFFTLFLRLLDNYSSGEILYFRVVFAVSILLLFFTFIGKERFRSNAVLLKDFSGRQKLKLLALTIGGGLLLVANWLIFIYVVNAVNIKTASFSYLICPVMTAVLGVVIIKEKLSSYQWIAVGLCTISCILIGMESVAELGYSLVIALTYALYLITQRKNVLFDRLVILFVQLISAIIIISPFFGLLVNETPSDPVFFLAVAGISLVFTIIPLFLNLYALKGLNSATIGILMYINPIINFCIGFFYFKEPVTPKQILGYLIIAIAITVFNLANIKKLFAPKTVLK